MLEDSKDKINCSETFCKHIFRFNLQTSCILYPIQFFVDPLMILLLNYYTGYLFYRVTYT